MTTTMNDIENNKLLAIQQPKMFAQFFAESNIQSLFDNSNLVVLSCTLGTELDVSAYRAGTVCEYLYFGAFPLHYKIGYVQYTSTDSLNSNQIKDVLLNYGEKVYYQMLQ